MKKILVVEDQTHMREILRTHLEFNDFEVEEATNLKQAVKKLDSGSFCAVLLDMKLPDGTGIELFDSHPAKLVSKTIVMTANATIPGVVDAMKKGASNYLEKPVDLDLLLVQINKIIESNRIASGYRSLKTEVASDFTFKNIVFESKKMEDVVYRATVLSKTANTVLIQGETGVGKEVLAHSIHNNSPRKNEIFLPLNCASIPTELFESELFGFEKGAFTGAVNAYSGRFIQADKGSLFLDEIGELPLHIQAKLLRILDEKVIYQLKSKKSTKIDVRLIAATNRDLLQEVELKQFRSDLLYRLKESSVTIPPLRERPEDILPLTFHFIRIFNDVYDKNITKLSDDVEKFFLDYSWKGNVRELKNTIKSIMPFKQSKTIRMEDLSYSIIEGQRITEEKIIGLDEYEKRYVYKILKLTNFNISRAASMLDISRPRLYRMIEEHNLKNSAE
ncbi:MAG: sigma-54-dependent Fis family transcriptional regulator [bacterium]|nr:sigma-54-dependent Fis family transcriptional regulator [bacterium]